jgi:hypothetical protein
MWLSYLIAFVPILVGGILWLKSREVHWLEWLASAAAGLLTACIFNYVAVAGMTADEETWSGQIHTATFNPEWVEQYQEAVYTTITTTDSEGRTTTTTVFSHFETRYRTHSEYWECDTTTGDGHLISQSFYDEICRNFNNKTTTSVFKSGFYSGDQNIYVSHNMTGFIYPTTTWRSFENRIKAAPSLFSYAAVPATAPVFEYPTNDNWLSSNRIIGTAVNKISLLEWDRLNARLGASKKVNLIIIGFEGQDSSVAHLQEAKWIGGKKNDLVLCVGDDWSYVFGWTEKHLVKRNLETIILETEWDALIPKIEEEVRANYVIRKWSQFDYITVEPPTWSYFVLILIMGATQFGIWKVATSNDVKESDPIGKNVLIGICRFLDDALGSIRGIFR